MMNQKTNTYEKLDLGGIITSGLCAIHCMALPVLFSWGAAKDWSWLHNPFLEYGFLVMAIVFAMLSLVRTYPKHHHVGPLLLASIGLALIIMHQLGNAHHHGFSWQSIIGGFILVAAHW